jgi:hypothetical protein
LYPTCEDGQKKLGSILELLKWKAKTGVTDLSFEKLLVLMKKMLPRKNELPAITYEAKKLVCPLGLDMQKIHTCPNDCILYSDEKYENMINARYALHCGIRSEKMTLVILRASHPGRGFLPK